MSTFAELEAENVRDHWAHEERDFSKWLADEIGTEDPSGLENTLGLDLEVIELEKRVGTYRVDIVAEATDDGRTVVVENQLEASDHDHLGKTIAYAAGLDADIIVWIAPKFNDEHQDAVQWLNRNSREGVDLFAIRLEVWRIADSPPALRMNPVEKPSEWKTKAQRSSKELTSAKKIQEDLWTAFRDHIDEVDTPLTPRKPSPQHWYNNPIGKSGFTLRFAANTRENRIYAGLLIRDDEQAYLELETEKEQIEEEIGTSLHWIEPEETRAGKFRSKIQVRKDVNLTEGEDWEESVDWLLDFGERFYDAFHDRIQQLDHV